MSDKLPHIKLIGDPEENFYQLGLKDKDNYTGILDQMTMLSCSGVYVLDKLLDTINAYNSKIISKNFSGYLKLVKAYADGVEINHNEIIKGYLLPEILSCFHQYLKVSPKALLGCSSFMYLAGEEKTPQHLRVLDFSLFDYYTKNERSISYSFKNQSSVYSLSTAGLSFPGLTAVSENGFSVALHQKFTDNFNKNGMPIFYFMYKLLQCSDKVDILKFCKKTKTLTTWGINILFNDGDILEIDTNTTGKLLHNEYNLHEASLKEGIYFCNEPLESNNSYSTFEGIQQYNENRRKDADKKLKKLDKKESLNQKFKSLLSLNDTKKSFTIEPITPSSIQINNFSLNAEGIDSQYIPGITPKVYEGQYLETKDIFGQAKTKMIGKISTKKSKTKDVFIHLAKAQTFYDQDLYSEAYHHLQMSIVISKEFNPHLNLVLRFFFELYQVIHEPHKRVLARTHINLIEMHDYLPSEHLKNLSLLFRHRLELLLYKESKLELNQLTNPEFLKIAEFEKTINSLLLPTYIKYTSHPRLELFDVVILNISDIDLKLPKLLGNLLTKDQ